MLYRLVHSINASYALAVAWLYIGAFALALGMLFVFPQVTLLLLFLGLASLGFAVMLGWVIDGTARGLARRAMNAGCCPRCGHAGQASHASQERRVPSPGLWTCGHCQAEFRGDGGQVDPRDRERWVEQPGDG